MVVLAVLVFVLAVIFGASSLLVLWPLAAVAGAVLYCLDRPAKRTLWPVAAIVLIGAGIAFYLAVDSVNLEALAIVLVVIVPLLLAAAIVLSAGGPARIKARHERAEAERRRLRAAAVARRRQGRKDSIKERTGVDVDLLSVVTRDRAGRVTRAAGTRLNRRLERHRPRPDRTAPDLLDLDQDVSARVSADQRAEMRRLAEELDRSRER